MDRAPIRWLASGSQPVRKVFSKFPRIVRDLSRKMGKEVELKIFGEDTELDKSVIEELGDPLVHLIRNAVDHGIEMPDERAKAGKNRRGAIEFRTKRQDKKAVVNPVLCKGDGLCNAKCPTGAIFLKHFTDEDLLSQIDAAG